ncbi:MAG: tetratricopeptide repeat protein, partial [Longimicrobiales bacterium]
MTRHPTARRVPRPAPSEEDTFVHGVLEGTAWAKQNARALIIAAAVVVALIVGFFFHRGFTNAKEAGATSALNDLRATVGAGNAQLAMRDGETLLAQYGGTDAAAEARLLMAQLHLQADQPAQAVDVLAPLSGDLDAPLGFNAGMLLGAAHEAAQQPDEAVEVYNRVGANSRFLYQQVAGYESAARVHEATRDQAAAIASYERILTLLEENAPQRGVYEMRLAELRTGGASPAAAADADDTAAPADAPGAAA